MDSDKSLASLFFSDRSQIALSLLIISLCVALRVLPALFLGVPYLPDPWVHIAKADEILQSGYFNILGDYDDHWPGLNILIALFAMFPGIDTITVGHILIPLLCSLSLVVFYLLIRRLTGNNIISLVSLTLMGFAAPLTLIMGTTYKEGLARLFVSIALLAFSTRSPKELAHVLPVVVLMSAIIPVHHFTFIVAGSIIIFVISSLQVYSLHTKELEFRPWIYQTAIYFTVFGFALTYFVVFGCISLLLIDARIVGLGLFIYFVIFGALNLRRVFAQKTSRSLKLFILALALILLAAFFANLAIIPVFSLTVLPIQTILMLLPFVGTCVLAGIGFSSIDRLTPRVKIFLSSWTFAILGLLFFAFFSGRSSLNLILTYRFSIFAIAPLCALAGIGVFLYTTSQPKRARFIQISLIIGLLSVLPVTTLAFARDPFFGYGCSITIPIQNSNQWLAAHSEPNSITVSDHLFTYYYIYYLHQSASIDGGIQLFVDGDQSTTFTYAASHHYMEQNGFWLPSGVQWEALQPGIINWLTYHTSTALIYNNGEVRVFYNLQK